MSLEIIGKKTDGTTAFSVNHFYPHNKFEIYNLAIILNKAVLDSISSHVNWSRGKDHLQEFRSIMNTINAEQDALHQALYHLINEELTHFYNSGGLTPPEPATIIDSKVKAAMNDGIIDFCNHLLEVDTSLNRSVPIEMYCKLRQECQHFFADLKAQTADSDTSTALDDIASLMEESNKHIKAAVYQ